MMDGIVYPLAGGIAGLGLLLLRNVLGFGVSQLSLVSLAFLAAWIAMAWLLGREYPGMLEKTLAKGGLSDVRLEVLDHSSIRVLRQALASPRAGQVIYALNLLEEIEHEAVHELYIELLEHPDPAVRREVLARIERRGIRAALAAVRRRAEIEEEPGVKGALLRALCRLAGSEAFDQVVPYLEHADLQIRLGATVGLLRSGGIRGVLLAGTDLLRRVDSRDAADRVFAARVLGEVEISDFHQPLVALLEDESPEVRRAVLGAAGRLAAPELWPRVVAALRSSETHAAAVSSLIAGGESTLPAIAGALATEDEEPRVLIALAQVCGRLRSPAASDLLRDRIGCDDDEVRTQVLRALDRCGYRAQGAGAERVHDQIEAEVRGSRGARDPRRPRCGPGIYRAAPGAREQARPQPGPLLLPAVVDLRSSAGAPGTRQLLLLGSRVSWDREESLRSRAPRHHGAAEDPAALFPAPRRPGAGAASGGSRPALPAAACVSRPAAAPGARSREP